MQGARTYHYMLSREGDEEGGETAGKQREGHMERRRRLKRERERKRLERDEDGWRLLNYTIRQFLFGSSFIVPVEFSFVCHIQCKFHCDEFTFSNNLLYNPQRT